MNTYVVAILCGLGLAAGTSLAQENPPPEAPPQPPPPQERPANPQQQVDVSDAEVQKFAEIFVDVQDTRDELSRELQDTESPQNAQQVQERMRQAITETIQEHGWNVQKYNRIATAINNDPEMREDALEIIDNLSS